MPNTNISFRISIVKSQTINLLVISWFSFILIYKIIRQIYILTFKYRYLISFFSWFVSFLGYFSFSSFSFGFFNFFICNFLNRFLSLSFFRFFLLSGFSILSFFLFWFLFFNLLLYLRCFHIFF